MEQQGPRELTAADVSYRADLGPVGVSGSEDLEATPAHVGQDEALEALILGLGLRRPGYNLFLAGPTGTGRFASVRVVIERLTLDLPAMPSQAYVHDFDRPDSPRLLSLPAGSGQRLHETLVDLRDALAAELPAILGGESLGRMRQELMTEFERETNRLFSELEGRVADRGFRVVRSGGHDGAPQMADIYPVVDDEPVSLEILLAAADGPDSDEMARIEETHRDLKGELGALLARSDVLHMKFRDLIGTRERRWVEDALQPMFDEAASRFPDTPAVAQWLDTVLAVIVRNLGAFRPSDESSNYADVPPLSLIGANVVSDPADPGFGGGPPIVEETYPTWRNLFGTCEAGPDGGEPTYRELRAGSLLRANGGFLLLSARDVLGEARVYDTLKGILRKGELEITPPEGYAGPRPRLKPAPVPIDVKVVLIGRPAAYDYLYANDPDFRSIFKVKAEFDDSMPRSAETEISFLSVIKRIQLKDGLPPLDRGALERLLEEGVRLAESRARLSTRFSDVADLMREAAHYAAARPGDRVERDDVDRAIRQRRRRHGLPERRLLELIRSGKIMVEVEGERVGQINGLAYYDISGATFATPARISATAAIGKRGVVNIEREVDLSGSIHDKGVLILSGFFAATFAQDVPLALDATVAFEQSYATVDGDSATLAELLALLSSLSGCPLRQDLAVTGSMNQRGFVQPVGGVNEKTEGFFRACAVRGLTGSQGVILPASNVEDLQLDDEVVAALDEGRFHIYAVTRYTEALELLTGRPFAATLTACEARLLQYSDAVRVSRRGRGQGVRP